MNLNKVSAISKSNVVESVIQSMVREAARCAELSDRVLYGDGWALAGCPADTQPRAMTKQASDLFQSLERDIKYLVAEATDLSKTYEGRSPIGYSIRQVNGRWQPITDMAEAFRHEKQKARDRWIASQANNPQPAISKRAEDALFAA